MKVSRMKVVKIQTKSVQISGPRFLFLKVVFFYLFLFFPTQSSDRGEHGFLFLCVGGRCLLCLSFPCLCRVLAYAGVSVLHLHFAWDQGLTSSNWRAGKSPLLPPGAGLHGLFPPTLQQLIAHRSCFSFLALGCFVFFPAGPAIRLWQVCLCSP